MAIFSAIPPRQRMQKILSRSRLPPQPFFKHISARINLYPSILPWPIIISLLSHYWLSIVLGFFTALGVFYFLSKWRSALATRRTKRIASLINCRLDTADFFYGSGGFTGRLIRATVKSDRSLNLEILRLDYSQSAQFLTSETVYNATIDASDIKRVLGRRRAIGVPEAIALGTNILRLLPNGSEYQFLVCQHHHAWKLSQRLKEYAGQLVNEIDSIDRKSKKYLDQTHIPDAKARLDLARNNKVEQHQQVNSALSDIGKIIEGLTVRIESIEDFGGLLLGIDDNLAGFKADSSQEQPLNIESVQQDCEEIALLLESYENLLS